MIPTQQFTEFPEFGNNATKIAPDPAKYAQGFLPADVLPAEWLNYFLNGSTKGVTALANGTRSIEQEINNVITDRGLEPSVNDSTQLLQALEKIKKEAILAAHPVGSLYWTSSTEHPAITFGGGNWVQIKDKFIWAKGDSDTLGATGGAKTVTLTLNNMPSHSHTGTTNSGGVDHTHGMNHHHYASVSVSGGNHRHPFTTKDKTSGRGYAFDVGSGELTNRYTDYSGDLSMSGGGWTGDSCTTANNSTARTSTDGATAYSHTHPFTTDTTGKTTPDAINIMPPYIVKFCWERVS